MFDLPGPLPSRLARPVDTRCFLCGLLKDFWAKVDLTAGER